MKRRAELVDSNIIIDLLDIPFEAKDPGDRRKELKEKLDKGVELYLPVAAVIEVGQHIQRIVNGHDRRRCAIQFEKYLRLACEGSRPWALSPLSWDVALVENLLEQRPGPTGSLVESLATQSIEMGDLTILTELRRMRTNLVHVDIGVWTRDKQLSSAVAVLTGG